MNATRALCILALLTTTVALQSCAPEKAQDGDSTRRDSIAGDSTGMVTPPPPPQEPVKKYGVRSGSVHYKNSLTDAPEILFFDDYGALEAYHSKPSKSGRGGENVTIYRDGYMYIYSVKDKIGEKTERPQPTGPIIGAIPDLWNRAKEEWPSFEIKELGKKTFLDHEATGYSFRYNGEHTVWLWEGIPLYLQTRNGAGSEEGTVPTLEAISISPDAPILPSFFEVPADVRLTERKRKGM